VNNPQLIRREVTADRGQPAVLLTTHDVLNAIQEIGSESFTSTDVADALQKTCHDIRYGRLECAARAALSWLMCRKRVRKTGVCWRHTKNTHRPYRVSTYALADETTGIDVVLLNGILKRWQK
jgi:hypothetical protein